MKGRATKSRPSDKRRQMLKTKDANKFQPVSNLTPIERYYDVAEKLKQMFEKNFSEQRLNDAYVYGMRFSKFSAHGLSQHDYYNAPKPELQMLKKKNQKDLREVIDALEEVAQLMDLEELEKAEIQRREAAALKKIREREESMRLEEEGRREQRELMDRLNALDTMFPKTPTGVGESQTNAELPSYEQVKTMSHQLNDLPIDDNLPPPIPFLAMGTAPPIPTAPPEEMKETAPPPPPSYDDLMRQNSRFGDYENDSTANLRPADSTSLRDLMNDLIINQQEPATLVNPLGKCNHFFVNMEAVGCSFIIESASSLGRDRFFV